MAVEAPAAAPTRAAAGASAASSTRTAAGGASAGALVRAAADGDPAGSVVDYGVTRDGLIQLRRRWPAAGPEPSAAPDSGVGLKPAPSPESAAGPARAAVYVLHGVAEHSGRYEHVGSALAGRGFETVATDHRGHGRSGGRRGHVDQWSQYLDDVEDQMAEVRGLGLPVVMLGHSLGGLMALSYCVEGRPGPDLLAVSAPALGYVLDSPQKLLYLAGPVLASLAAAAPVSINRDLSLLSSDPEAAARAAADPLWSGEVTVSLGWELLRAMARTRARLDRLEIPVMCVHGSDDGLVPAASSEILATAAGAERRVYDGLRHEVFNEPAGLDVLTEVIDWIESNLPAPAGR